MGFFSLFSYPPYPLEPDKTFFSQVKCNFDGVDITADNRVPLEAFLKAADEFHKIFLVLKITGMGVVYTDMNGNIKALQNMYKVYQDNMKVRTKDSSEKIVYVDDLVFEEIRKGNQKEVYNKIFYLFAALDFGSQTIASLISDPSKKSTEVLQQAYANTLQQAHGGILGVGASKIMMLAPDRETLLTNLGSYQPKEKNKERVIEEGKSYQVGLEKVVQALRPLAVGRAAKELGFSYPDTK